MKIGVISDTHGYLNPKIYSVFDGVQKILHAGDIGTEDIITGLETIAPVLAVHGNMDHVPLNTKYPAVRVEEILGVTICMVHQFLGLKKPLIQNAVSKSTRGKIDVIIYGHTHKAKTEQLQELLLFNPGPAGRQRNSSRPSVGLLTISENGVFTPEIIVLNAY